MATEIQWNNEDITEMYPEEYTFNLSDFALFLSVMKEKKAYQNVLSIILDESDVKVTEVKVEQVILNKFGKRAIRLDAWGRTDDDRQVNIEMENHAEQDNIPKRSRFYQGLIDTPILKAGKKTKYKQLPSTIIIFITQEDIFKKDLTMYTFTEQCEEIQGLQLGDGTKKIFLNMSSKNGSKELVSLLQYMKNTTLDNPDIQVKDERIIELDKIVTEVRESEEWEEARMTILELGMNKGIEIGEQRGMQQGLVKLVCKKLIKGYSIKEIANHLEEDEDTIRNIVEIAQKYAPEYDTAKILKELWENK
ncbi:MAG: Rpn family recombination-promoting nuclease/putative transposase [Lachnospiraceae bacterium]|nr:Rpn family recombination-promoting nuclease/putative transposase [Lachnospiraceae bacterium]